MQKSLLALCIFFLLTNCFGQEVNVLNDSAQQRLSNFSVLPDDHYTIDCVSSDSTLAFTGMEKLAYHEGGIYWVKILIDNPSKYAEKYSVYTQPFIDNTVYYYNQDDKKWEAIRTGALSGKKARFFGIAPCNIQGGGRTAIYIRVDLSSLGKFSNPLKTSFSIEKESVTSAYEQKSWAFCLATILVVLMFLIYNAIIFFNTRDRAYLYYLLIQIGGILYIAANFRVFNYLFSWQHFQPWISHSGTVFYYHLNLYIERLGMVLAISSYVQFTRNYLQTRQHFPLLDKVMRYLLVGWIIFELVHNTVSFSGLIYLEKYTTLYSNLAMIAQLLLIIAAAAASKIRGVYAAKYFLWTNLSSLLLLILLAAYYSIVQNGVRIVWLPCAAIISQAVLFSMALVARMRLTRSELANTQNEANQLKTDIEQLEQQHQQLTAEHQQIEEAIRHEKSRNEVLEDKLATNNRQLASATLYIVQKNELLGQLKTNIKKLGKQLPHANHDLGQIESNLQSNQFLDHDWEKFRLHFEQVHPRFFEDLKARYSNLTKNETRLCAYFHMNLSTKEIAGLLNIDPASVRKAKMRLGKKVDLSSFIN